MTPERDRLIHEAAGWVRASTFIYSWAEDQRQKGLISMATAQAIMQVGDLLKDQAVALRDKSRDLKIVETEKQ